MGLEVGDEVGEVADAHEGEDCEDEGPDEHPHPGLGFGRIVQAWNAIAWGKMLTCVLDQKYLCLWVVIRSKGSAKKL